MADPQLVRARRVMLREEERRRRAEWSKAYGDAPFPEEKLYARSGVISIVTVLKIRIASLSICSAICSGESSTATQFSR